MWPHKIALFSHWYTIIAIFITGILVCILNDVLLRFSRWKIFYDDACLGLAWMMSAVCCIVLLIVDVDHPVEVGIFYLFLLLAVVYPLAGLAVGVKRRLFKNPPDPEVMCGVLTNALKGGQDDQILTCLENFRPGMILKDQTVLVNALCDARPKIRLAAAVAATAVQMDEKIASSVQGDQDDFRRLGELGDIRFLKNLETLAQDKKKPHLPAILGIMALADAGGMTDETAQIIISLFQSGPKNARPLILDRLLQMNDGGEIYDYLLKDEDPGRRNLAASAYFDKLKAGNRIVEGSWENAARTFAMRNRPLIARMLCLHSPGKRKTAAGLCTALGMDRSISEAVQGNEDDFIRLGRLDRGWILERLIHNAQDAFDKIAFPAIKGIAAMVETGTVPKTFDKFLSDHSKKGTAERGTAAAIPADRPEPVVPLAGETLETILSLVEGGLVRGVCHENAGIRTAMARVAPILGLDPRIPDAIQGDEEDYQRLGALADPRFLEALVPIVEGGGGLEIPAARAAIALCDAENIAEKKTAYLERMALKGPKPVRNLAVSALLDMGEAGSRSILNLLKDARKSVRKAAARALAASAGKAKNTFNFETWWELRHYVATPHGDVPGIHQDGYHCDYDRGCSIYGCDPHLDIMTDAGAYRAHRVNRRVPHTDNQGH